MKHIEALLICDGSSDVALQHHLRWILDKAGYRGTLNIEIADSELIKREGRQLNHRIEIACKYYKPDVLFIHRDAEKLAFSDRLQEVYIAIKSVEREHKNTIPIIPVRMLEAWLLFDEIAIRRASGNPNGRETISLPQFSRVESEPDPKQLLNELLTKASGLSGRRLKNFKPLRKHHLVAEEISDFSPLLKLQSFSALNDAVTYFLKNTD
jgi:hypothetical protein